MQRILFVMSLAAVAAACSTSTEPLEGGGLVPPADAGPLAPDASQPDGSVSDADVADAGRRDTGGDDCPVAGEICIAGASELPPAVETADRCEVVEGHLTLLAGQSAPLQAVVRDTNGRVLVGVPLVWTSDAPDVAVVAGTIVRPGAVAGAASLRASLGGNQPCQGVLSVHHLRRADGLRVSVVSEGDGAPVANAAVTLMAASQVSLQTDARGIAVTSGTGPIAWVTVDVGDEHVTVMSPGARDLVIKIPTTRVAVAGGVRGKVDVSRVRNADVPYGVVGPGLPAQLLDFGRTPLIGEDPFVSEGGRT